MLMFIWELIKLVFGMLMDAGAVALCVCGAIGVAEAFNAFENKYPGIDYDAANIFEAILALLLLSIIAHVPVVNWVFVWMIHTEKEMFKDEVFKYLEDRYDTKIKLWELKNSNET